MNMRAKFKTSFGHTRLRKTSVIWLVLPCVVLLCRYSAWGAGELPTTPANPGFENGAAGWNIPSKLWCIEPGEGRGGSAALVYDNSSTSAYTFPQCPLALEPGVIYRYGAWVKTDSLKGDKKIKPRVSLDFADAGGNWIGAEYAEEVGQSDADGWVRYEGVTAPVSSATAHGNLFGFVPKGGAGHVRFDDFTICKIGERFIDGLHSSAYRNEADSGKVRFLAPLFVNSNSHPLDTLAPVFVFTGAEGADKEIAPDEFDSAHAAVTVDVASLAQGTHPVAFILRTCDGRELARASAIFTRASRQRRVSFDRFGRTIVNGRPFFPLGMYARDVTPETLALYTNGAPWNCVMPYHAPAADMLDLCDQAGLKVVYCVKDVVFGSQFVKPPYSTSREASLKEIARRSGEAKGHPAILAYYTNDEAPPRQAEILREVGNLLHRIDPDHPVWHVMDKEFKIRPMLGAFDVIGTDPYPIGLEGREKGRSEIGEVSRIASAAQSEMFDLAPVWQVVQAFDWSWDNRWKDSYQRFPTREEISCMTWQAIASGANGVIFYAFHRLCMGAPPDKRDEYLHRVIAAGKEVRSRMDTLLSDPGPAILSTPDGAVCRTWRTPDGNAVLLAANATCGEVSGRVAIAGGASADIALPPLGHLFVTVVTQP